MMMSLCHGRPRARARRCQPEPGVGPLSGLIAVTVYRHGDDYSMICRASPRGRGSGPAAAPGRVGGGGCHNHDSDDHRVTDDDDTIYGCASSAIAAASAAPRHLDSEPGAGRAAARAADSDLFSVSPTCHRDPGLRVRLERT